MSSVARDQVPEPGALRTFRLPPTVSDRLDTGLSLKVTSMPRLPLVSVLLVLDAGETTAPAGREGVAVLTGEALRGGTTLRDAEALAEALEGLGAHLGVGTGWDSTTLGLTCHADRLPEALALLAEVALSPAFDAGEVEQARDRRLATLQQRRMSPAGLADDVFAHAVFADSSPYARPLGGLAGGVAGLDAEGVRSWWAQRFSPATATLIGVGDVDPAEFTGLTREAFGAWADNGGGRTDPAPATRRADEPRVVIVDRPGAVQSELRMGGTGVPRSFEPTLPLKVFNGVLGGVFTSRLNLNLREKNGFTYGVRSRFGQRRGAGPFSIAAAVGADVTADAAREAHEELRRLMDGGPTADEVASVREFMAGVFPLQMETASRIASKLSEQVIYDLPDDYYATYRDRIRQVDLAAAWEAGREAVPLDHLVTLVVGDAESLAPRMVGLGLGAVEVIAEDEVPPFYG
jgi:zinc protease